MTSSTTTAAANGGAATARPERQHGLFVLRGIEAKALVHLATEAVSETASIGHQIHTLIYDGTSEGSQLRALLEDALLCWQTADHYLRMLGSVLEEREYATDRESGESPF